MTGETKRDWTRHKVDAFVKIGGSDREFVFRTRDLSRSGLFLYTKVANSYPFKVGSTLSLELFDHDQSVRCTVVVARVVQPGSVEANRFPTGFGVRIVAIDDTSSQSLETMLKRAEQTGALV